MSEIESMPFAPLLELRDVSTSIAGYEILHGVSLAVAPGERLAIMGPAGSGKSTLLKVMAGLTLADRGQALFDGRNIGSLSDKEELEFRRRASFAFQDGALWENQSVLDNLTLSLRIHRAWMSPGETVERARSTLARLGYTESAAVRPAELSLGERKLVSIARALVLDPELIFLDDPTGHLDEDARERVFGIVDELAEAGRCIVAVTNNSDFARRFARTLAIVSGGRLAYCRSLELALGAGAPGEDLEAAVRTVIDRLKRRRARDAGGESA